MFRSLSYEVSLSICQEFNLTYFSIAVISFMQDTPLEKLDKKHFAKGARASEENRATAALELDHNSKEIALVEAKMKKLCDLLDEVSLWSIIT
jgi:hypothetical protein